MAFTPPSGTLEYTEFTGANDTVSVADTPTKEYSISEVTYHTSNGMTFPDMILTHTQKSFHYNSTFDYAVDRVVDFTVQKDDYDKNYKVLSVNNISKLPPDLSSGHYFHNPIEYITVYFEVSGLQRDASVSGEGEYAQTSWGSWYSWSETYTVSVYTNWDVHQQLVLQTVENQGFIKRLQ